jgi:hypothetical protein
MPAGTGQSGGEFGYWPREERAGARHASRRRRRGPAAAALVCGLAGFLLGAGFWAYMGLRELGLDGLGAARTPAPGCTALSLDRPSGRTVASPCPAGAVPPSFTAQAGSTPRP